VFISGGSPHLTSRFCMVVLGPAMISKYKAHSVAKGFQHQHGCVVFVQTSPHVIKPITVQIVFTIALSNMRSLQQIDLNNYFLHTILEKDVYMTQPPGFESADKRAICKLHKAVYWLMQAPRAWQNRLTTFVSYRFDQSKRLSCLPILHQNGCYLNISNNVDSTIVTGDSSQEIISGKVTKTRPFGLTSWTVNRTRIQSGPTTKPLYEKPLN